MIGFIGGGNMAEALIKGMTSIHIKDIYVSEPQKDRRHYIEKTYGVKTTGDNIELGRAADIIIVAVKPQIISGIAEALNSMDLSKKTLVSIAAGVSTSYLRQAFRTDNVIRVMPNTPALVLKGMSVIAAGEGCSADTMGRIVEIFSSIGKIHFLSERHMDAVTALSGSGPAFIALFVEGMIQGGIALGLNEETASLLTLQTLAGTAELLASHTPEAVIKMVSSPGGTTVAGLKAFNDRDVMGVIAGAICAAASRSAELNIKTTGT
ncbi:MAG: pyrroline-5-carboxylate reductase [Nitrospirae bacterium]|nr:pyrroline-5-carboxylate reductase [Nitrospirota bacterium]